MKALGRKKSAYAISLSVYYDIIGFSPANVILNLRELFEYTALNFLNNALIIRRVCSEGCEGSEKVYATILMMYITTGEA